MIKVRSGQVWASNNSKNEFTLNVGANGLIHGKSKLGGIYNWDKSDFHRNFKFIPQNDLEWLAVKVESLGSNIKFIARRGSEYLIFEAEPEHTPGVYTSQHHQRVRYHLGLDKKPHYRQVKGEWVKQC